jgi:TonB family protein
MKTKLIFLLFFLFSVAAAGQDVISKEGVSISPAKFTGIQAAVPIIVEHQYPTIESYLKDRIAYPQRAQELYAQGTEIIGFTVSPNGELTDFKVINSVCQEIDDAVIQALEKTNGMWTPGGINGENVAMEKEVTLVFKLSDQPNYFNVHAGKYFTKGAEMVLVNHNPAKALKFLDKGIVLLPNDRSLLAFRGLTRFELGDKTGAVQDWTRIKKLGGLEGDDYIKTYVTMNGYEQMMLVLGK